MLVYFDTLHLYYLTQFLPVFQELKRRGIGCKFFYYANGSTKTTTEKVLERKQLPAVRVASPQEAATRYHADRPEWVIFGNRFSLLGQLHPRTKTAQLYHGIGMKSDVYQPALMEMDIRFTEGPHYTRTLQQLFPNCGLCEVGYAKLDPMFGPPETRPRIDLGRLGLDSTKPTILYAPTFYPSSIEMMSDHMPDHFGAYNLIVKPHMFTWSKPRYHKQRRKLGIWGKKANCHIPAEQEFNLLPFMNSADLMISDASSALFEFAALDKPVVWCDFLKLRWTYRGVLGFRLKRRMDGSIRQYTDIAAHARSYDTLLPTVRQQLEHPEQYKEKRQEYTQQLIGKTDGKVSGRIANYLVDKAG